MEKLEIALMSDHLPIEVPLSGLTVWDANKAYKNYVRELGVAYRDAIRKAKRNHQFIVARLQD